MRRAAPGWLICTAETSNGVLGSGGLCARASSTSRLARDRLHAALFERELRKVGVAINYATGGGDPSTPEGSLMIGMQQLWDEFERNRLSRQVWSPRLGRQPGGRELRTLLTTGGPAVS